MKKLEDVITVLVERSNIPAQVLNEIGLGSEGNAGAGQRRR